jgi:hypothetical protein
MKEGKGKKQLSLPPSLPFLLFLSVPSSNLLASDSLRGSFSHISEAEVADAIYKCLKKQNKICKHLHPVLITSGVQLGSSPSHTLSPGA